MRRKFRLFKHTFWALLSLCLTASFLVGCVVLYFILQLPNVEVLKDLQLQAPLKIYTRDEKLIAQYGAERRNPIPIKEVPKQLIDAVLATEDHRFFQHSGVDIIGLVRAAYEVATTGTKSQGGSTITMQVARNYFLTRKKTYTRKIKEILLAIKINADFSKEKVLELYLNKIYFGNRAYGIAAAAQVYYGKPLNELALPQYAMLAGLPKAPSAINPLNNSEAAKERRQYVLSHMLERGYIDQQTYQQAISSPLTAKYHGQHVEVNAPYIAEMVRDALVNHYGEEVYSKGYKVYTTISSDNQQAANNAVRKALLAYDQRHGYRGPIENLGRQNENSFTEWLANLEGLKIINELQPAAVLSVEEQSAQALLRNGDVVTLPWQGLKWARKAIDEDTVGPMPKIPADVVKIGDIIYVEKTSKNTWRLAQIPQVEGALIALNPHDGAIQALVGGFSYDKSKFNRVTQAERQPGSSFKPFVYAAALAKGYTLASIINDAPVVINDPSEETLWRPQNDTRRFYGPTRLLVGLTRSRNLVSIRLLEDMGIQYAVDYVSRFGFNPAKLAHSLSLALGASVVSPLEIATGYAVFANGGYKINPYLIDRITNEDEEIIYQAKPKVVCDNCQAQAQNNAEKETANTDENNAQRRITPQVAYLMNYALRDVIKHGTGRAALSLKRNDLAGKTGTTNDQVDAWFSGFNSNLVTTVWVGFDAPRTLHEYGAKAALPMWIDFMKVALKGKPESKMSEPSDIVAVRIDKKTGLVAREEQSNTMFELFRKQYAPTQMTPFAQQMSSNDEEEGYSQPLY